MSSRCPKGRPDAGGRGWSAGNRLIWEFDRSCRAVGRFPEDALVERHARIIRDAEEEWSATQLRQLVQSVARLQRTR